MRWQQNATELRHVVGSHPASYSGSGIGLVIRCHISELSKFLSLLKNFTKPFVPQTNHKRFFPPQRFQFIYG